MSGEYQSKLVVLVNGALRRVLSQVTVPISRTPMISALAGPFLSFTLVQLSFRTYPLVSTLTLLQNADILL